MSHDHCLQTQRFELKYLVDDTIASRIRDFVSSYLVLDDYAARHPTLSYPVHSLYLDSDDLKTCHATLIGARNRFKLRLRYYDDQPGAPVFFEIKARADNCILKQRCGVRRDLVPLVIAGQSPGADALLSREPCHWLALQRFIHLQHLLEARPRAHTAYRREAWVSPHDNSVRVTFDRDIRLEPFFQAKTPLALTRPVQLFAEFVVLKLKLAMCFPSWYRDLVETFHLVRGSAAKYVSGVLLLGKHRFCVDNQADDPWGAAVLNPASEEAAQVPAEVGPLCGE